MASVLRNYTLYSSEYLRHTFLKKTIRLPKNANIISVHENIRDGLPCAGLAISILEEEEIKEFEKYEFLIFPLDTSNTVCIDLKDYTLVGTANTKSSYYKVYYKIVRQKNCCDN